MPTIRDLTPSSFHIPAPRQPPNHPPPLSRPADPLPLIPYSQSSPSNPLPVFDNPPDAVHMSQGGKLRRSLGSLVLAASPARLAPLEHEFPSDQTALALFRAGGIERTGRARLPPSRHLKDGAPEYLPSALKRTSREALPWCVPLSGECQLIGQPDEAQDQSNPNAEVSTPAVLEESLRSAVSERVGATRFALWFGGNVRLGLNREGNLLVVRVPDPFFRDWIERHYAPTLAAAVEAVVGRKLGVSVQIESESEPPTREFTETSSAGPQQQELQGPPSLPTPNFLPSTQPARPGRPVPIDQPGQSRPASSDGRLVLPETSVRPTRRLEDFVPGPGNRVAFAAATEMARTAGRAFNPLMIHSAIGLGKSHLLEGINRGLKQFHPKLQIVQLTAEAFTNGFLDSMRSGNLTGFRAGFVAPAGSLSTTFNSSPPNGPR